MEDSIRIGLHFLFLWQLLYLSCVFYSLLLYLLQVQGSALVSCIQASLWEYHCHVPLLGSISQSCPCLSVCVCLHFIYLCWKTPRLVSRRGKALLDSSLVPLPPLGNYCLVGMYTHGVLGSCISKVKNRDQPLLHASSLLLVFMWDKIYKNLNIWGWQLMRQGEHFCLASTAFQCPGCGPAWGEMKAVRKELGHWNWGPSPPVRATARTSASWKLSGKSRGVAISRACSVSCKDSDKMSMSTRTALAGKVTTHGNAAERNESRLAWRKNIFYYIT